MKVDIRNYPKRGKRKRKVSVRIEIFDTYSLNHTLSLIIVPALTKFLENGLGTPVSIKEEEWKDIIRQMIWSFDQIKQDKEINLNYEREYCDKVRKGLDLFAEWYQNLWW
jgi:transcription antitermination factor NusG